MNTIKTKGLFIFATMPAVLGLLLSACGGGDGGTRLNQSNISIGIQDYEFTYPRQGATNVCTYPTFQVAMKNSDACTLSDISSAIVVYDTTLGPDHPIALNEGAPFSSAGTCTYKITPKQALGSNKTYGIGLYNQPGSSAKTVLPNTAEFTTGSANSVDCGNGSRFVVENVFGASRAQATEVENIGTWDENGDYHFDAADILRTGLRGITSSIVSLLLGTGTLQNNTQTIYVKFNEQPNPMTLVGVNVFQMNISTESLQLTQAISGISVVPSATDPYMIEVRAPSRGYPTDSSYSLYIGPVLSISGKPLSQAGASSAKAYVSFFRVGSE